MFIAAARARRSILQNFATIGYEAHETAWRSIRMGVKRDIQARRLRPNVPVPSRRNPFRYFTAVFRETRSVRDTFYSFLHDGAWTSSGGSFLLAEQLGFDLLREAECRLQTQGALQYLEVGGGWAGMKSSASQKPRDVAGLARYFGPTVGETVVFHFTNLTQWHSQLPRGINEHPYVTAAGLSVLDTKGIQNGSIDILYSQAAAYFEVDVVSFLVAASTLLRAGGLFIFNFRPEHAEIVSNVANSHGLLLRKWLDLGGMNGVVVAFEKQHFQAGKVPAMNLSNSKQALQKQSRATEERLHAV